MLLWAWNPRRDPRRGPLGRPCLSLSFLRLAFFAAVGCFWLAVLPLWAASGSCFAAVGCFWLAVLLLWAAVGIVFLTDYYMFASIFNP